VAVALLVGVEVDHEALDVEVDPLPDQHTWSQEGLVLVSISSTDGLMSGGYWYKILNFFKKSKNCKLLNLFNL
jgi:hypothetical protein